MFLFRNQRLLKLPYHSLSRYNLSNKPVKSATDLTVSDISRQIVHRFHPIVVGNFLKTLETIFKSTKHYTLILSAIHYKAGPELRYLLDWLTQTVTTGELTPVRLAREGTKRDSLKNKLTVAYKNYWRNKNCLENGTSEADKAKMTDPKLESIVTDLLDLTPFEVTTKIVISLQLITNSPAKGKSKPKIIPSEAVTAFFSTNIQTHKSHLIHLYPFLELLDIPHEANLEAQTILKEIEKSNSHLMKSLSVLLTR
jgi:hypothetical protein